MATQCSLSIPGLKLLPWQWCMVWDAGSQEYPLPGHGGAQTTQRLWPSSQGWCALVWLLNKQGQHQKAATLWLSPWISSSVQEKPLAKLALYCVSLYPLGSLLCFFVFFFFSGSIYKNCQSLHIFRTSESQVSSFESIAEAGRVLWGRAACSKDLCNSWAGYKRGENWAWAAKTADKTRGQWKICNSEEHNPAHATTILAHCPGQGFNHGIWQRGFFLIRITPIHCHKYRE